MPSSPLTPNITVSAYFTCVTKLLYNLLYFQVVIQMSCQMNEGERAYWRAEGNAIQSAASGGEIYCLKSLEETMSRVIMSLDPTQLYPEDDNAWEGSPPASERTDKQFLEKKVSQFETILRTLMCEQWLMERFHIAILDPHW